ncbi:MAG: SRPBCC domain-containing protein [Polyangiaceae bacterium]
MNNATPRTADQARVSVLVRVPKEEAFRVFTEEIDQWWRRGLKYRVAGAARGVMLLECKPGGRLFESFEVEGQAIGQKSTQVFETGRISHWDPPNRLVLNWRLSNFAPDESTEVEVEFESTSSGTLVTVTHRGWSAIRDDHPARHGQSSPVFLARLGFWWGELFSSLRMRAERVKGKNDHGNA